MLRTFNCGIGMVIVAANATAPGLLLRRSAPPVKRRWSSAEVEAGPRYRQTEAKGKGDAEAVDYIGQLRFACGVAMRLTHRESASPS